MVAQLARTSVSWRCSSRELSNCRAGKMGDKKNNKKKTWNAQVHVRVTRTFLLLWRCSPGGSPGVGGARVCGGFRRHVSDAAAATMCPLPAAAALTRARVHANYLHVGEENRTPNRSHAVYPHLKGSSRWQRPPLLQLNIRVVFKAELRVTPDFLSPF